MGAVNSATAMGARGLPGQDGTSAANNDFWRSNAGATLPDGGSDTTEAITRTGLVGIGNVPGNIPAAQLDVARGGRSGVDGRTANTPAYITGTLPAFGGAVSPPATPTGGIEFRHSNQTQGLGFTYDGIYATGSNANQNLALSQRGAGQYFQYWQTLLGGLNYLNYVGPAIDVNEGWYQRWFAAGTQEFGLHMRRSARVVPGGSLGNEIYFQHRAANGGFRNALSIHPSSTQANTAARVEFGENDVNDDKIVLWGINSTSFFGFGIKGATLASFVNSTASFHRWYAGPAPGTMLFSVSGVGNVTVDPNGTAPAGWAGPLLRFGGEGENEGIKSQRTGADRFAQDIEIYTGSSRRFAVLQNGRLYAAVVPTFASDAAAGAGGLAVGEVYKLADGTLRIKL